MLKSSKCLPKKHVAINYHISKKANNERRSGVCRLLNNSLIKSQKEVVDFMLNDKYCCYTTRIKWQL